MPTELELVSPSILDSNETREHFLTRIRRQLHQNPELGFEEFETSSLIRAELESRGLEVQGPFAKTGIYTDIIGDHPGPLIAYRADMDALPIQDQKTCEYASKNDGVAHLCGHDFHTTVALGVALELNSRKDELKGAVRVFFQPNEEGMPSGAPEMIKDGILEGVSAAYAIHAWPSLKLGHFGTRTGSITAACDSFQITLSMDSTGHSARPHATPDPVFVCSKLLSELYQLPGRVNDARNGAVITICKVEGGTALNVIPKEICLGGTLRCIRGKDRNKIRKKIKKLCKAFASIYNVNVQYDVLNGAPPCDCDSDVVRHINSTLRDKFGEDSVLDLPCSMGAEDFSHYLKEVPGALFRVGTSDSFETSFPLHDDRFDISEKAIMPTVDGVSSILIGHLSKQILA